MTSAIEVEDIKDWRGEDVVDREGEKLGKLDEVYYDAEADTPAFAAVKSGTIGKHLTLVPLADASVGRSFLRVAVVKDQFKKAPSFDTDVELTSEDEASAYGFFSLEYTPVGSGARRLAKR